MIRPALLGRASILTLTVTAVSLLAIDSASAGPNANGTLILHYHPSLPMCIDIPPCEYGATDPLQSCSEAITNVHEDETGLFTVYAAFAASDAPRLAGVAFGIDYDPDVVILLGFETCGDFELANENWPEPGSGTAVTWSTVQTGQLTPVYGFSGYSYSYYGTDRSLDLVPHPTQGGVFADDDVPSNLDPIAGFGSLGFGNNPGSAPCPTDVALGACCLEDCSCIVTTRDECQGTYYGDGEVCDPNPCDCPVQGACCLPDGSCVVDSEPECDVQGGQWMGKFTECDPDPCVNTPIEERSWGQVKGIYR
ncbi:MAG: hypothetical protein KDA27_14700 [Candidatus Eisenbacteria bacterium]|uniref:SMB domain-containing protein n=1 Tax=Eiseniibacteriota bacterium TaxID=2212470 RepID=A0A956NEJ9_UNCEI|nr:hypothetical protein [Candidatus Eisenbacteria bacterium]